MPRNWTGSPSRWLIVASVIALVALGGIAYAAIPDTGGVIHGCYDSRGALSVVDPGPGGSCATGETALSWSQQGPQGAQGPAGRPGTTLAASPPRGYSVVDNRSATLTPPGRSGGVIAGLTLPAGSYFVFAKADVLLLPAVRTERKAGQPMRCVLGQADATAAARIAGGQPHMLDAATLGGAVDAGSLSTALSLQIEASVTAASASQHVLLSCGLVSRKAGGTAGGAVVSDVKLFAIAVS